MPRFVVLRHDSPSGLHWDLMLEMGSSLATWALSRPPDSPEVLTAKALADHRPAYLDYQGPVSGGRGSVTRWDQGTYRLARQSPSQLVVVLRGEKLAGRATLDRPPEDPQDWRFSFAAD